MFDYNKWEQEKEERTSQLNEKLTNERNRVLSNYFERAGPLWKQLEIFSKPEESYSKKSTTRD